MTARGWLHEERDHCYTNAIVIVQWAYWVCSKEGQQRRDLQDWLRRLIDALGGRVLEFDVSVAYVWADHLKTPRELTRVNGSNQHVSIWKWDSLPFGDTLQNENPSSTKKGSGLSI